jgi:hypothetical protein
MQRTLNETDITVSTTAGESMLEHMRHARAHHHTCPANEHGQRVR